jgi:hypothetical protein
VIVSKKKFTSLRILIENSLREAVGFAAEEGATYAAPRHESPGR